MKKTPTSMFFNSTRKAIAQVIGEDNIYSYIPGADTKYPFAYLGESDQEDIITKWYLGAEVNLTAHFFTDRYKNRGSFTDLILKSLDTIKINRNLESSKMRILTDTSTGKMLLHGVLELTFKIM